MTREPIAAPDRALLSPKRTPLPLSLSSLQSPIAAGTTAARSSQSSPRLPVSPRSPRTQQSEVRDELELPQLVHSPRLQQYFQHDDNDGLPAVEQEQEQDEDAIRQHGVYSTATVTGGCAATANTNATIIAAVVSAEAADATKVTEAEAAAGAIPGDTHEQTGKYSTVSSTIEGNGWWPRFRRMWIGHVSVRVSVSKRREHLALERTFLGYLRTSLALSMIGVLVAQLLRLDAPAKPAPNHAIGGVALAAAFIAGSIMTVLAGAIRFWRQQVAMVHGKCWAGGPELLFIWGSFFALTVAMFVIMLIQPDGD